MLAFPTAYMTMLFAVPIAGIMLNGYVLVRLMKVARKSAVRFETTSGLPLAAMSIGDSITLASLLFEASFFSLPKSNVHFMVLSASCKIGLYLMHTTSAFSVWCWLVLSVLRYTAVFHPIKYRTIWRQPRNALKTLAIFIGLIESYILFIVTYHRNENKTYEGNCSEYEDIDPRKLKFVHLSDIFLFYAVPSLIRITLDFLVLLHCYSPFSLDGLERIVVDRRYAISGPATKRFSQTETESLDRAVALSIAASAQAVAKSRARLPKKKTAMVMRSIVISVLNLFLNLPSHVFRAWATVDDESISKEMVDIIEPITTLLYFSQFICNAFYLATSIYETNGSPRNTVIASSQRHVSRCISEDT